jgi:hypothetical protein
MATVKIRNKATGILWDLPYDVWRAKKNTPEFRGVFERVTVPLPPEVVALKARKAATK